MSRSAAWLTVGVLLALGSACRDRARGRRPTADTPRRVVSTVVASDEILLDLVGPERLVAITRFSVKPEWSPAAKRLQAVKGRINKVTAEAVLAHRPDLVVIASYTPATLQVVLKRAGVKVVRLKAFTGLGDIRENIRRLGKAVGEPKRAGRMIARLDTALEMLRRRGQRATHRPEVLNASRGFIAGTGTIFNELVQLAGGKNVAARLEIRGHTQVGAEVIWRSKPDYVVVEANDAKAALKAARADPLLSRLEAVKTGNVLYLPHGLMGSASHLIVRAAALLMGQLHPELTKPAPRHRRKSKP